MNQPLLLQGKSKGPSLLRVALRARALAVTRRGPQHGTDGAACHMLLHAALLHHAHNLVCGHATMHADGAGQNAPPPVLPFHPCPRTSRCAPWCIGGAPRWLCVNLETNFKFKGTAGLQQAYGEQQHRSSWMRDRASSWKKRAWRADPGTEELCIRCPKKLLTTAQHRVVCVCVCFWGLFHDSMDTRALGTG